MSLCNLVSECSVLEGYVFDGSIFDCSVIEDNYHNIRKAFSKFYRRH